MATQHIILNKVDHSSSSTSADEYENDNDEQTQQYKLQTIKQKLSQYFKTLKRDLTHTTFHKTQGRSYFCEHTCSYWGMVLLWLLCLYCVLAGLFIAYMAIASELVPFSFLVYKSRDPSSIPIAPSAGVYFSSSNATSTTNVTLV